MSAYDSDPLQTKFRDDALAGEILTPKRKRNSAPKRTSSLASPNDDEEVCSEAEITGKIVTNHSARKTIIPNLRNSGFNIESIMEKSGHKNVSSV